MSRVGRLGLGAGVAAVMAALLLEADPDMTDGPGPLRYDGDACERCGRRSSQPGLGGELRDPDGRLTRYDDVGCLLVALESEHREVTQAWVEDHAGGGFVPLIAAYFVLSDAPHTPTGFGVTAFLDEGAARAHALRDGGTVGRLEDVLRDTAWFPCATASRG